MHKKILSKKEVFEAGKFVETICRLDGDGFAAYDDGWSDQKVADKFGVTLTNIQDLRRQIIGNARFKGSGGIPKTDQLSNAVGLLEARIVSMDERLSNILLDLEVRVNRLERCENDQSLKAIHGRLNGIIPRIVKMEKWIEEEERADMEPYLTKGQGNAERT